MSFLRRLVKNGTIYIIGVFVLFACNAAAQKAKSFDSVLQLIQEVKTDTARLRIIQETNNILGELSPRQGLKLDSLMLNTAKVLKADSTVMQAYILMGRDFSDMSDFTSALKNYFSALDLADKANNYEKQAQAYDQISWIYKTTGEINKSPSDLDKAIEYIEKGLDITRKHNLPSAEAGLLNDLAIEYDIKKMHAKAIETFQMALNKAIEVNNPSRVLTAYMNMGISYKNNKELDKSLESYKKAMHIADSIQSGMHKMYILDNMANLYNVMGQLQLSETTGLDVVRQSFLYDNQPIRTDMYEMLKNVYAKQGKYKEALDYSEKLMDLKDSVLNKDKSAQLKDMQEKYETDIKSKLITAQQSQITGDKKLNTFLSISGICVLLIAGFIYYNLNKTARLNRTIVKQRDELGMQSEKLSVMMKELHHRVKNNLQIVSSLLNLQSLKLTDDAAINAVQESKQRVQAMALIHQRLYKTDDITRINMKDYIRELAEFLATSYGYNPDNFTLDLQVQQEWADIDKALPIGLILNELITNAFKYAYDGVNKASLHIGLTQKDNSLTLTVKDNGKGIDADRWNSKQNTSFGKQLIKALCSQLRAKEALDTSNGTSFTFTMPAAA